MSGFSISLLQSPTLRLELRPSRMLAVALGVLGVLSGISVLMSELQAPWSWLVAVMALSVGVMQSRMTLRAATLMIVLRGDGAVEADGLPVVGFATAFQGPLTQLRWAHDGRILRRVAWPDVLDASTRRELRLWTLLHRPTGRAPAVAG